MIKTCLTIAVVLTSLSFTAKAEMMNAPDVATMSVTNSVKDVPLKGKAIGELQIFTGQPKVIREAKKALIPPVSVALGSGNAVSIPEGSRGRITLPYGDFLHVKGPALFSVENKKSQTSVNLWNGKAVFYVMPALQGRAVPMQINTRNGSFYLSSGKTMVVADNNNGTSVSMLENRGKWVSSNGETKNIRTGQHIKIVGANSVISKIEPNFEQENVLTVSPEMPVLKDAIVAFSEEKFDESYNSFKKIQEAYPYNAGASFYLGQILLDRGDIGGAIKQWQKYEKLDPKGALENKISEHLTVLISEHLNEQIKDALDNEKKIGDHPPIPNSVAVSPFTNKGNQKYNMLSKGLAALLIADLAKIPGLKVLERQKVQKLLDEIALSESGLVNEKTAVRAGRLMKAEKIVLGDFSVSNSPEK